jgi:Carboxypeptidase regulatory-like domain
LIVLWMMVVVTLTLPSLALASYTVVPLSDPNVSCVAVVSGMDSQGDLVGMADFSSLPFGGEPTTGSDGFFWRAGSFTPLNVVSGGWTSGNHITGCGASGYTYAGSVNDSGTIVGSAIERGVSPSPTLGSEWSGSGASPAILGTLCTPGSPDISFSQAYAINAAGDVAGQSDTQAACNDSYTGIRPSAAVLRLAAASQFTAIAQVGSPVLGGGVLGAGPVFAQAVNAHDQAVVVDSNSGGQLPSAYLWQPSSPGPYPGTLTALPLIPYGSSPLRASAGAPPGLGFGSSFGLNDAGVAVGTQPSQTAGYSAVYSVAGAAAQVLTPVDGLPMGVAEGIDNRGDTVGVSFDATSGKQVGTLWPGTGTTPGLTGVDLNTLLPAGSGVTITEGVGINDNGDIVAFGTAAGNATWIELQPAGQQISGTLVDSSGHGVPGAQVNVTGTDDLGNAVNQAVFTDINGNYTAGLNPGQYVATPVAPTDTTQGRYVPSTCSGSVSGAGCAIALNPGDQAIASFKLVRLVVNSTALTPDPSASLALDVCDTTPSAPSATCTLTAAMQVLNQLGGGTITFDIPGGGTPTITESATTPTLPQVTAPMEIDATTQPGAQTVALTATGLDPHYGLEIGSPGVTVRGMTIYGFAGADVYFETGSGSDTLQANQLETINSTQRLLYGVVVDDNAIAQFGGGSPNAPLAGHNVIQGNTIGGGAPFNGQSYGALTLREPGDTIGGSQPGQGNIIAGGVAFAYGIGDVLQGNTFRYGTQSVDVADDATVGGATSAAGTGAGNVIHASLTLQQNDVVQGNQIDSHGFTGISAKSHDTIGGARPQLGNLIENNGTNHLTSAPQNAGIGINGTGTVVEHNLIRETEGDGGVAVYSGDGNHIFENSMVANTVGINLGGGSYRYNALGGSSGGPNHYQPYPDLLDVRHRGATVTVTGQLLMGLSHAQTSYTIDLYNQAGECAMNSISPGEGLTWLKGGSVRTDGIGDALFTITAPRGSGSVLTLTATAPDGSTSEFSPCLTLGHSAPSFAKHGVTVPIQTVTVSPAGSGAAADRAAAAAAAKKPTAAAKRLTASIGLFCPPVTTGYCAGTAVVRDASTHALVARLALKLAPGQLHTPTYRLSRALSKRLVHARRLTLTAVITARDHAKHAHHKRTTARLRLVYR